MSIIDGKELFEYKPKLSQEEARGFAALAWSYPANKSKIMDVHLALAFAEILDIVVNGGFDTVDSYIQWRHQMDEDDAPSDKTPI